MIRQEAVLKDLAAGSSRGVAFIVSTTVGGLCGQLETPSGQAWRPRIDSIGDACDIEGDIGKRIAEKSENRATHLLRWHSALL